MKVAIGWNSRSTYHTSPVVQLIMATTHELCYLHELYGCTNKNEKLQTGHKTRIETMIKCSEQLHDSYHEQLKTLLVSQPDTPQVKLHKSCVSRYTSSTNVQAHVAHVRKMSCDNDDQQHSSPKRLRSSVANQFDFKRISTYSNTETHLSILGRLQRLSP